MTKKTLICLLIILSGLAGAQIRDYVPIVRPNMQEATVKFLDSLAESMEAEGYPEAAEYLKAFAKGGFGSGFVHVDKSGRNFVVTNRHVVSQARTANLDFESASGTVTTYRDCPVLSVSEELDLALIAFPEGVKPFRSSLPLSLKPVADGEEVWSAGYPALLDRPSWQLAKGNVTNAAARVPELADPAVATLYQHSAPVDSGNSGGPLVVADKSAVGGYRVIGVNTWKVIGRDSTNFSIPSRAIDSFISQALAPVDPAARAGALERRARDFVTIVNAGGDSYLKLPRFISDELVTREGERLLSTAFSRAPEGVRAEIGRVFGGVSPIEGIRLAIAFAITEKAGSAGGLGFGAVDGSGEGSDESSVRLSIGESGFATNWVSESGSWKLKTFSPLEPGQGGDKGSDGPGGTVRIQSPYLNSFGVGFGLGLGSQPFTFGVLEAHLGFLDENYFRMSVQILAGKGEYLTTRYNGVTLQYEEVEDALFGGGVLFGGLLQLPLLFDDFALVPYGSLSGGVGGLYPDPIGFMGEWKAGMLVGFGQTPTWGIALDYRSLRLAGLDTLSDGDPALRYDSVCIYLRSLN